MKATTVTLEIETEELFYSDNILVELVVNVDMTFYPEDRSVGLWSQWEMETFEVTGIKFFLKESGDFLGSFSTDELKPSARVLAALDDYLADHLDSLKDEAADEMNGRYEADQQLKLDIMRGK